MSQSTARVLGLLELLQAAPAGATVGDLAGRLAVDERTVRRYASQLIDLGIPIEARRGRHGGYRLAAGFKLPPLMLTDDEAVAVVLGLVSGRRAGLATAEGAGETALAKISRVLPERLRDRTAALVATLDFAQPARPAHAPGTETLLVLAAAARDRVAVRFRYRQTEARRLDPYGLVFHGGRWYVTGHDRDREALRTFRLDRIDGVTEDGTTFTVPPGFDPAARVAAGIAAIPWAHQVSVRFDVDLDTARRRLPPTAGSLTAIPGGGVRLVAGAERLDGMARMLAGLGWPFQIERPAALSDEVRALAAQLASWA